MVTRIGIFPGWLGLALLATSWLMAVNEEAVAAPHNPPTPEEIDKAEKQIREQFKPLQKPDGPPLMAISDGALSRSFPEELFLAVVFRQYPVARVPSEPLKPHNLFAVQRDGKIQHMTNTKELEAFFRSHIRPVGDEGAAKDAVRAWLQLSAELKQDGYFKFSVPADAVTVAMDKKERKASGKGVVTEGGKGEFSATLRFDAEGKLTRVEETAQIKAGVRPICQATKLLDLDPIVRRMAEQDILVMGRAARSYLDEQRAKASPDLQAAIDRVWRRIVEEGW